MHVTIEHLTIAALAVFLIWNLWTQRKASKLPATPLAVPVPPAGMPPVPAESVPVEAAPPQPVPKKRTKREVLIALDYVREYLEDQGDYTDFHGSLIALNNAISFPKPKNAASVPAAGTPKT